MEGDEEWTLLFAPPDPDKPTAGGKGKSLDGGGQMGLWALGLDQQPCIRQNRRTHREIWKAGRARKSYGDGLALEGQFCGTLRTFVQI